MSFVLGASALAVVTAVACALPGVFVVLRKNSMLVDAISHAVLPGIVVGYFITRDLESPLLILGAALAGDRKSTRLNSSHVAISYAVFCLKKKRARVVVIAENMT